MDRTRRTATGALARAARTLALEAGTYADMTIPALPVIPA